MVELAIIQLSDIHLTANPETNWIWKYKEALIDAITRFGAGADNTVLVFSGDIAQSGSDSEYSLAIALIDELKEVLALRGVCEDPVIVCVPGNHDHNFRDAPSSRQVLMRAEDEEINDEIINQITCTQDSFFKFAQHVEDLAGPIEGFDRLCRLRTVDIAGHSIVFNLLNTAWTSMKNEEYGSLRWHPKTELADAGDHIITVLHHPLAWLNPTDAHSLRKRVESASDLIMTGHIHVPAARTQTYTSGESSHAIEAGALQEREVEGESKFHVLKVSLFENKQTSAIYSLREGQYECESSKTEAIPFNPARSTSQPKMNSKFEAELSDAGHGLTHPRKANLQIEDFFVMPYLMKAGDGKQDERLIKSNAVTDKLNSLHSLVIAPESAGKTSFAKAMFRSFRNLGFCPVMIRGEQIAKRNSKDLMELVEKAIANAYEPKPEPAIWNKPYDKRVLIIDDLHLYRFDADSLRDFLSLVKAAFGTLVSTAIPDYLIQDLVDKDSHAPGAIQLEQFQLLEFGHRQQHELVRRWCSIGLGLDVDLEDFERVVYKIENHLKEAVRTNFIPSFPSYLVLMLQSVDAHQSLDPTLGAYGQLYQCVIFQHLYSGDRTIDTETKSNFLAGLASWVQASGADSLPIKNAKLCYAKLSKDYALSVSWEEIWPAISRTRLVHIEDDLVRFRYKFVRSYFYSLHIVQQLEGEDRLEAIRGLVDSIHLDESASTLLCLLQHTKDRAVVDIVLDKARSIFSSNETIRDINDRTMFINTWINELPALILTDGDLAQRRVDQMDAADDLEMACDHSGNGDEISLSKAEEQDKSDDIAEMQSVMSDFAAGYRIVQVMGQMLRAFSGSLKADQKAELCRECFDVAMRTLDYYLKVIEEEKDDLALDIAENLQKAFPKRDVQLIARDTGKKVFYLVEIFGVNVFKHMSNAIGTNKLEATLQEVLDPTSSSDRMINMSIKLDHYKQFPKSLVEEIVAGDESRYTAALTRDLVWLHLHLVERKRELRQQMCEKLGIQLVPKMLYNKEIKKN